MFNREALWQDLREKAYEKKETNETISWKKLNQLMEEMEYEQDIRDALTIKIDEEEMKLAVNLERFSHENGGNCYDYLEYISVKKDSDFYQVGVFTEPVGIIGFEGKDLKELLTNIYNLYSAQPQDMNYIEAGHILWQLQEEIGYPLTFGDKIKDIKEVWENKE